MPLCIVITRDVEDRYRGFLGSAMLEISPGVYAQPRMSAGVRDRLWGVMADWHAKLNRGSIVMTWSQPASAGALGVRTLGTPARDVVTHEGLLLARRTLDQEGDPNDTQETRSLKREAQQPSRP